MSQDEPATPCSQCCECSDCIGKVKAFVASIEQLRAAWQRICKNQFWTRTDAENSASERGIAQHRQAWQDILSLMKVLGPSTPPEKAYRDDQLRAAAWLHYQKKMEVNPSPIYPPPTPDASVKPAQQKFTLWEMIEKDKSFRDKFFDDVCKDDEE